MTDVHVIALYGLLALFELLIIGAELFRRRKVRLRGSIVFLAAMVLLWLASETGFHLTRTPEAAKFMYSMNLPFVSLATLAMFFFVMRFYSLESYLPPAITLAMFVIPAFTLGLALTSPYHDFLRQAMQVVSLAPLHEMRAVRGVWFWVHAGYSYLLVFLTVAVAVMQHTKLPKVYRLPSTLLIVGVLFCVGGNYLVLTKPFPLPVDLSLVGAAISVVPLYLATLNNQGLDNIIRARNEIFNDLNEAVMILDDERMIIQKNAAAAEWLESLGCPAEETSYDKIALCLGERVSFDDTRADDNGGVDVVQQLDGGERIYNLFEKPILDNTGNRLGLVVICNDVTENRRLIARLEERTGQDALTGLENRRHIQQAWDELDTPENLPLTVMMADLNDLKFVNDNYGHQQGDVLLRLVAETLTQVCPPTARLARVGGDEFLVLLPGTSKRQAQALIADVKYNLKRVKGHPFTPSLAMGFAVKDGRQGRDELFRQADEHMYADKRASRRAAVS